MKKGVVINFLFILLLLELFLGGGGRLTEFNGLTLRMYLFFLTFLYFLLYCYYIGRYSEKIIIISLVYGLILIFQICNGFINHASASFIFEDVKPLSYFFSILFFGLVIKNVDDINRVIKIIKITSLLMAAVFLFVLLLMNCKIIPFTVIYPMLNNTGEFFFRNDISFVYKGFLYLNIGLFFYVGEKSIKDLLGAILIIIAIFATLTRGFILALALTYLIKILFIDKKMLRAMVLISSSVLLFLLFSTGFSQKLGNKSVSDNIRIVQIKQVTERISPISFFIGHGFGVGVPVRDVHMEIAYLEIFHKQGLLGILFWICLLFLLFYYYKKAKTMGNAKLATPFLLGSVFIYLESATNPFITNPIGMSMVIISFLVLSLLAKQSHNQIEYA